ncbi:DNA helicase PIF1, ATP-dependent [Corchorus olitorius]|uniref:ATP-dependent DNA helicase n=1 Tax=Corchorus olitorius TaxID=93759 RepID=A0A1R3GWC7_9ROSI|nr:DNA helicase PIF1, ATP-dependent [Corchorus olitorius]
MPPTSANRLIHEETHFNVNELQREHDQLLSKLNPDQAHIYDVVVSSVMNSKGRFFFVNGHGGTGKTFLWRTIISGLRCCGKIVLAVASSRIALLLLPGGRTTHSCFKKPLTIDEWSTCNIKRGTQLARSDSCPRRRFQTDPPVVPGGTKNEILDASISTSQLWQQCTILPLRINMRLQHIPGDDHDREELAEFAYWILKVGEGDIRGICNLNDSEKSWIKIPHQFIVSRPRDPFEAMTEEIYPNLVRFFVEPNYVKERAIVTLINETVDALNHYILDRIPGEAKIYLSSDSLSGASAGFQDQHRLYPPEILNKISVPGVPDHKLDLKKEARVLTGEHDREIV